MKIKNEIKAIREGFERRLNVLSDLVYIVQNRKMMNRISFGAVTLSEILSTVRRMMVTPGLTKREVRQVRAFYAPYKVSTLTHRQVKAAVGDFHPAYIPGEMYFAYIDPYLNSRAKAVGLESKALCDRLFPGISQPKNLAYRINGYWLSADYQPLTFDEVLALANAEEAVFFKKSDDSYGGRGVVRVSHTVNSSLADALARAAEEMKGDLVLQMPIHQHSALARFNSSSLNTYRITTYLTPEGKVYVCTAVFRTGVGDTPVDNFCAGGVMIGIDGHGRLTDKGYMESGEIVTKHPQTEIRFEGYALPHFKRAVALAKRAHPMLPMFRLISWDFAIEENGTPVLVEANLTAGGIEGQQICNGPFFRNMTRKVFLEAVKDSDFPQYHRKKIRQTKKEKVRDKQ